MKITSLIAGCVTALAITGSTAMADVTMTGAQINALINGNTLYVEIPAGAPGAPHGGTAPVFYATDGAAAALLPAGLKLVGTWALDGDSYCIDWNNGPKNSCTTLVRNADGFAVIDASKGEPRGIVRQIATGNPENL
ncbi:hypothetical protein [Yoonia sp. SS1-5]|uniref:Uncharacterized protein n=1 Tax=Yoonia rhodophyticola TaxID=3137370 RepID=A0AAN0MBT2_9RHOB